jgi:hypothetical protein
MSQKRTAWLVQRPLEIFRLAWCGQIVDPAGARWQVSFCPGVVESWKAAELCARKGWKSFRWATSPSGHWSIVCWFWTTCGEIKDELRKLVGTTGSGFKEGLENIRGHWENTPFGWLFLIFKNLLWNCFACPIAKIASSLVGVFVGCPVVFALGSVLGCVGRLTSGLVGSLGCLFGSAGAITGGTLASGAVAMCAVPNRFPRASDDGTFGVYKVANAPSPALLTEQTMIIPEQ